MSAGIVLFWLLSTGWLFWNDLLPRLLPGQPPPYTIDPVEEARRQRPFIDFTVGHNGAKAFRARTEVARTERDVYELTAEFIRVHGSKAVVVANVGVVQRMSSRYRVNAAGDLLGVSVRLIGKVPLAGTEIALELTGDVEGATLPLGGTLELAGASSPLQPRDVPVGRGGALLLPLHPVNRMRGLRPGQTWTTYALEPVPAPGGGVEFLRARVRDEEEQFDQGRRHGEPCLVIDYTGDRLRVSTWVSRATGLVLAQEVTQDRDRWTLSRE
jgi:hypothetical protein